MAFTVIPGELMGDEPLLTVQDRHFLPRGLMAAAVGAPPAPEWTTTWTGATVITCLPGGVVLEGGVDSSSIVERLSWRR